MTNTPTELTAEELRELKERFESRKAWHPVWTERLLSLVESQQKRIERKCQWAYNEAERYNETACGEVLPFDPNDNNFKFCPNCGGKLEQPTHPAKEGGEAK